MAGKMPWERTPRFCPTWGWLVSACPAPPASQTPPRPPRPPGRAPPSSVPAPDGYEPVTELRQRRGQVHLIVVAVTGHNSDEDKRRAYESGFDLHVAKPMDVDTLKDLLKLLDPEHESSAAQSQSGS